MRGEFVAQAAGKVVDKGGVAKVVLASPVMPVRFKGIQPVGTKDNGSASLF